jgi:NADPH2:quinone reductase
VRAVVCDREGEPEDLRVEERQPAALRPGSIRVAVRACGLNYVDALFVQGRYQIKPAVPFVPGSELAGDVVEVAPDVVSWAPGDRVFASIGIGAFCDEVVIDATQAVAVPDGLDAARAATVGQSYCTGVFALEHRARLQEGQWLLVLGAGGGVGLAAVDIGRAIGARVIAAASTRDKLDAAVLSGAEATIDYSTEPLKERAREISGGGVDVVYDPIGGDLSNDALRTLRNDGQLVVIGFASGSIPRLEANQVLLRNRRVTGVDWGAWALGDPAAGRALLDQVLARIADGTYRPVEPSTYPLTEAAHAMRDLLERRVTGKAVLVP